MLYTRQQVVGALFEIEMHLASNYSRLLTIDYGTLYHVDNNIYEDEFYQRLTDMAQTEDGVKNAAGFLSVGNYTKPITRDWIQANPNYKNYARN